MTAQEYLKQIAVLTERIWQRLDLIEQLRANAISVKAINYDDARVRQSLDGDRLAETVAKLVDMENELADEVETCARAKVNMTKLISDLPDPDLSRLLYMRYVKLERWKAIESMLGMEERHIHRMHGAALGMFEERYAGQLGLEKH